MQIKRCTTNARPGTHRQQFSVVNSAVVTSISYSFHVSFVHIWPVLLAKTTGLFSTTLCCSASTHSARPFGYVQGWKGREGYLEGG